MVIMGFNNCQKTVTVAKGKLYRWGGGGSVMRMVGTEGVMNISGNRLSVCQNKMAGASGYGGWYSCDTFSEAEQLRYQK